MKGTAGLGRNPVERLLIQTGLVFVVLVQPAWAPSVAKAQTARPEFDVATIKPNASGCCTSSRGSADQLTLTNQTLKNLIVLANPHFSQGRW
jgi:hypothetical protein